MQQKAFTLINRGMNRDLSVSKAGESSAYENHNIRIEVRDKDTMLSVTNERGNKAVSFGSVGILGTLIGWNVLNEHLILFTTRDDADRIYRIDYDGSDFHMVCGSQENKPLYQGPLGFDVEHPIESVVYEESAVIKKIYWVDGKNVLRFMNFMADDAEISKWDSDDTYFDSNKPTSFGVKVSISKDNSGNTRANGTVQYFLTYYNKHGQQTGIAWASDLVYLSPLDTGGAVDGTNNNRITLDISNLDTSFSNFRVYSVVRTSLNGQAQAYIVTDGKIENNGAIVIDDASHLIAVDPSSLLYLGSQYVKPGTMTHKDQTLFLGDLQSVGRSGYDDLETTIQENMFDPEKEGYSSCITFSRTIHGEGSIDYVPYTTAYPYANQLSQTSSEILSFKGGEKYRFALSFQTPDGIQSDAFWIGDAVNPLYPSINSVSGEIDRIIATCTIPSDVREAAQAAGFATVKLMIAEATYADRSVKAQGIVNPTVFNVWNRYNKGLYAEASWITRTRRGSAPGLRDLCAYRHFEPIHSSTSSTGEIECNYWETEDRPTPYYLLDSSGSYVETFDGSNDYNYIKVIVGLRYRGGYWFQLTVVHGKTDDATTLAGHSFVESELPKQWSSGVDSGEYEADYEGYSLKIQRMPDQMRVGNYKFEATYAELCNYLRQFDAPIIERTTFTAWCQYVNSNDHRNITCFFNTSLPNARYDTGDGYSRELGALNAGTWDTVNSSVAAEGFDYVPSYYKKHLMFVDENVVTLNSPEIQYEALNFDKADQFKFRIVGAARITGRWSDYTVDASPGKLPGENLVKGLDSDEIIAAALWREYGLMNRTTEEGSDDPYTQKELKERTSYDYLWGSNIVHYWMHLWNHQGSITAYTDYEGNDYGYLRRKTFANMRYSYQTFYNDYNDQEYPQYVFGSLDSVRIFNYTNSQYVSVKVGNIGNKDKYYNGNVQDSLSMPGSHKYPILCSSGAIGENAPKFSYLYSNSPINIEYASNPHAVISLGTVQNVSNGTYEQNILPWLYSHERPSFTSDSPDGPTRVLPWEINMTDGDTFPSQNYTVHQDQMTLQGTPIGPTAEYVYIGEIYRDFDSEATDSRYGGISDAAVKNCRFITAGPAYELTDDLTYIIGNQGDTYFQRWDCMKTKPFSTGSVNNVIDVTSVMLETHINLDGRSDQLRETKYLASIDAEKYGELNPTYSQQNNYVIRRDLDSDANLDVHRATLTWTLAKTDSADIDEWSHITLANTLKLDGDKGVCQALRRFQNNIIAFQDRSISEILFNSRTQISTTNGVPIEIANSGKVDGKRYITNKFGCTNKWSIVEGKGALYFVDNINKTFCAFNGQGIDPLSSRLGFDAWFREINTLQSWTPKDFNNIVSFYDRIHSDVYLVRNKTDKNPCLVYNEPLGAFTSFFDYGSVSMMTNIGDKFVSFRGRNIWRQNEGLYGNFFGEQKDFSVWYRVTPNPFSDKVWSGFDYRADFYHVLDNTGASVVPEAYLINGDSYNTIADLYKENETFDTFKVWDEYQSTGDVDLFRRSAVDKPVTKDFRIWRRQIPRALKLGTNIHGLDRIRNPWINLSLKKAQSSSDESNQDLMQLHDVVIRYFE